MVLPTRENTAIRLTARRLLPTYIVVPPGAVATVAAVGCRYCACTGCRRFSKTQPVAPRTVLGDANEATAASPSPKNLSSGRFLWPSSLSEKSRCQFRGDKLGL